MLTSEKKEQIRQSLRKWVSSHQEVGKQIEKATSELAELLKLDEIRNPNNMIRPIVDRTTFTVSWQGPTCQLGNTLLFCMEKLASAIDGSVSGYYGLMIV